MGGRGYEWHRDGMNELFYVLKDIGKIKEMIKDDTSMAILDYSRTHQRIRLAIDTVSDWLNNQFRLRRWIRWRRSPMQIWPKDGVQLDARLLVADDLGWLSMLPKIHIPMATTNTLNKGICGDTRRRTKT